MGEEAPGRSTPARAETGLENGDAELDSSPLAQRLRNLSWPTPEPGRAEASWERFQERLAELEHDRRDGDDGHAA